MKPADDTKVEKSSSSVEEEPSYSSSSSTFPSLSRLERPGTAAKEEGESVTTGKGTKKSPKSTTSRLNGKPDSEEQRIESWQKSAVDTISTDEPQLESGQIEPSWDAIEGTTRPNSQSTETLIRPRQEMTRNTASISVDINPSSSADHFLGHEAPQLAGEQQQQRVSSVVGPFEDEPRSVESNLEAGGDHLTAEESEPIVLAKQPRTGDDHQSETGSNGIPDVNDLLSGLLNVVGEGLNLATNYVKEERKRKKSQAEQEKINSLRTRINNRGPPRFSEVPFEAIPLEVLSGPPRRPPVANGGSQMQRPFRPPQGLKPTPPPPPQKPAPPQPPRVVKVTKTLRRKPPFATGIPLPELLVPPLAEKRKPTSSQGDDLVVFPGLPKPVLMDTINVGGAGESDKEEIPATTTEVPLNKLEHTYFPDKENDEEEEEEELQENSAEEEKTKTTTRTTTTSTSTSPTTEKSSTKLFEAIVTDPTTTEKSLQTRFPPKRRPRPPKLSSTTERTTERTTRTTTRRSTTTTPRTTTMTTRLTTRRTTTRRRRPPPPPPPTIPSLSARPTPPLIATRPGPPPGLPGDPNEEANEVKRPGIVIDVPPVITGKLSSRE